MQRVVRIRSGVTLVEIMVAAGIFLIAAVGILYSFTTCLVLNEIGKGTTLAVQAVRNKIEIIKSSPFAQISATYNNTTFTVAGINGRGVIYVDNTNSRLLLVKVVFCWAMKNGRVLGEDKNLNGVLNTGEDSNANGEIDSTVQLVTRIYG